MLGRGLLAHGANVLHVEFRDYGAAPTVSFADQLNFVRGWFAHPPVSFEGSNAKRQAP